MIATTPRSVVCRKSRPAPCAISSAACVAATSMNPLRPAASAASFRACSSGSSGRGNGILSIITSEQLFPGTSTPCHRVNVPNRHVFSCLANLSTSAPMLSSPWHSTLNGRRRRNDSVACSAARRDENSPRVRPPAAMMSSYISDRVFSCSPSRPGNGTWRGT